MNLKHIICLSSALILGSACQQNTDGRVCETATVDTFQALIQSQYVDPFKAGESDEWLEIFSLHATGLHNRIPALVGRDAIAGFGKIVAESFRVEEMAVTVEEVDSSGDWAFARGSYTNHLVDRRSGESAPWGREQGKFFMLWACEPSGAWRIRIDMGNSNG